MKTLFNFKKCPIKFNDIVKNFIKKLENKNLTLDLKKIC